MKLALKVAGMAGVVVAVIALEVCAVLDVIHIGGTPLGDVAVAAVCLGMDCAVLIALAAGIKE